MHQPKISRPARSPPSRHVKSAITSRPCTARPRLPSPTSTAPAARKFPARSSAPSPPTSSITTPTRIGTTRPARNRPVLADARQASPTSSTATRPKSSSAPTPRRSHSTSPRPRPPIFTQRRNRRHRARPPRQRRPLASPRPRNRLQARSRSHDPATGQLDWNDFERKVNQRTKLVAVGAASNALGTITDVRRAAQLAHSGRRSASSSTPSTTPRTTSSTSARSDCDFLMCSAYKFYGPHVGILWCRRDLLESLPFAKLDPAPNTAPERAETGTLNHEGIAGAAAAVELPGLPRSRRLASRTTTRGASRTPQPLRRTTPTTCGPDSQTSPASPFTARRLACREGDYRLHRGQRPFFRSCACALQRALIPLSRQLLRRHRHQTPWPRPRRPGPPRLRDATPSQKKSLA